MRIHVRLFANLRDRFPGGDRGQGDVDLDDGASLADLIDRLEEASHAYLHAWRRLTRQRHQLLVIPTPGELDELERERYRGRSRSPNYGDPAFLA